MRIRKGAYENLEDDCSVVTLCAGDRFVDKQAIQLCNHIVPRFGDLGLPA